MSLNSSKRYFSWRRHTRSFLQSFKWFKAILTSYHISHQTSPQTRSWIGLRQGEILKLTKMSLNGSKRYFSWKKAYADHFCKVSSDLKPFLTSYHISHQTSPQTNHGLGFRQNEILKTYKNGFDWLKTIFFMKKGIRDHFCKVSSDLKHFDKLPYFTPDFPTTKSWIGT